MDSEEKIGAAVSHRRKEFYLFTKCGHAEGFAHPNWRPEALLASIERSLKRLRTGAVDLIQLHSCSLEELPRETPIAALERARDKGYAHYIGYGGDGQAARFAVECGRFDTLQTSISIADQRPLTPSRFRWRRKRKWASSPKGSHRTNAAWRTGSRLKILSPALLGTARKVEISISPDGRSVFNRSSVHATTAPQWPPPSWSTTKPGR